MYAASNTGPAKRAAKSEPSGTGFAGGSTFASHAGEVGCPGEPMGKNTELRSGITRKGNATGLRNGNRNGNGNGNGNGRRY